MGESNKHSRLPVLLAFLGIMILAFVCGAFSATFKTFPYPQLLERPFMALQAQKEKSEAKASKFSTAIWEQADGRPKGLTEYLPKKASKGYTFYTSAHRSGAFLIDMEGNVVHEWNAPFPSVWPDPEHLNDPIPPQNIYWREAELLPNGDVVAVYVGGGDTPWGYGLARVNKDSEVVWKYGARAHHDVEVLDSGAVYAITQRFRDTKKEPVPNLPQLASPVLDDSIIRLSPKGKLEGGFSVLNVIASSPYRAILQMYPHNLQTGEAPSSPEPSWDPLHTNNVEVVGESFAKHYDFVDSDHLIISSRTPDLVAIIDFESEEVVWATRGFWHQQHDPDPLPNGNVLIFDNNGYGGPGGPSRIVEFGPLRQNIAWSYSGTKERPFWTGAGGSQQKLSNGNVLVTSTTRGRIFEVTTDKKIVWEYYNPVRQENKSGQKFLPVTCSGKRYQLDELLFLSK